MSNRGDNDATGGESDESGAYAQFKPAQLRSWAIRLFVIGGLLVLLLWLAAGRMQLFARDAEHALANLVAVWLLTFGALAFLIGVILQLASLRVAKLRTEEGDAKVLEAGDSDLGGVVKSIGDVLKSAKVPVAAMLVGSGLMVMAGFIAFESVDDVDHDDAELRELELLEEMLDEEAMEEEVDRERHRDEPELADLIVEEICFSAERSDLRLRELGQLGRLLAELCSP